jgi:hypothetical protein
MRLNEIQRCNKQNEYLRLIDKMFELENRSKRTSLPINLKDITGRYVI